MNNRFYKRVSVRASVAAILGAAALAGYTHTAVAAADESAELEEVQVTGSRILRPDFTANSPLVSIDSAALESKSGLNIEAYLNQLPNYNPAATPTSEFTNSDVQISSVNSVGIASISLRGFGANRGLVLIDGRRAVPSNALMVVDINGIPSSMIKRVEIISGGASATYGADALGGVSNFLLRRDFQGLELDAQWGTNQAGDGDEARASVITGTDIADGRGNIVFAAEYYDRKAAFDKNRDFYTEGYKDPTVPGNFIGFIFGENGYNNLFNPANAGTLGAILGKPANQVFPFPGSGVFAGLRFNPDGSIFDPAGNNADSFGIPLDDYRYSLVNAYDNTQCNSSNATLCPAGATPIQQVKYNETEGYTANPQTRFSFMAAAEYDITDTIKFSSSARFAQSTTTTFLAGTNASFGWEASIPYNATTDSPVDPSLNYQDPAVVAAVLANPGAFANPGFIAHGTTGAQHPVPVEMAILMNSRANAPLTSPWVLETYPLNSFGRRATSNVNTAWQIESGLSFELPVADWTGEVYYSRGESSAYNVAFGNNSLARWRGMVTAPDYGRGARLQSNLTHNGPGASPGFGSVAVPCTSGFYETIFHGDAVPSADCQYAVQASLQTRTQNQQDIGEVNFQGGLFALPAGEVRAAVGYQYRRNASQFNPDILQSTASFTDQVIGVYPTGYLDAQTKANDVFAELLVPVLADTFVKKVELEIGGRYSDYDKTDSTTTYKINGNIQVNDSLRFRGGYNRATRAPNLGEMFLPLQQIFTGAGVYGDPCGVLSNSPFGAGGAIPNPIPAQGGPATLASGQTAAGAQSAYLICQAQMGTVGAAQFYGTTVAQPAATGGGFAWVNQIGNPNLDSEKADTWTAGVVIQSPFEHVLLSGLTATVDWYQIAINDAILPYSIDYARYLCYGAVPVSDAAGAAAQAASQACQFLPRNQATGGVVTTQVSYDNQATVKTSGIDFAVNWVAQLADLGLQSVPGGIGINVQGTWLDYYKTKQSPATFDPEIDWKGSLGPNLQGFNGGAYDYRVFTSLSYTLPSLTVSLRWRHLPKADTTATAQENAVRQNNAAVAAGAPGAILSYTPGAIGPAGQFNPSGIASYNVFDLSGFWTINDTLSLRMGIDNLLDRGPATTTRNTGYPLGSDLGGPGGVGGPCDGAPGCQNPTAYSIANSGQGTTNGGYYDVLGRRFYVGLKARF
jgi:outer membrane receptor protein involved in Fe transport